MNVAKPRVALVRGDERYGNISRALELIEQDVNLDGARLILVKPNLISVTRQEAATHVDAVRAVLDFLRERSSAQIVIAEGTGSFSADTELGFSNFGYLALSEQYGIPLVDLNADEPVQARVYDHELRPMAVRLARTAVAADYRVSIALPKTHDYVGITAALKNMLMGSLVRREHRLLDRMVALGSRLTPHRPGSPFSAKAASRVAGALGNDKMKMHQGYAAMNLNLYKLARVIPPQLCIIDGLQGMEGEGPVGGEPVPLGIAIASTDFVAADSVAAAIMGFPPQEIGYLCYCARMGLGENDVSRMELLGQRVEDCVRPFKPHPGYAAQRQWRIPDVERYLE